MIQPRILKGFRDFPPNKMKTRIQLQEILRKLFERYGFQALDTPILEYSEILEGKYGEEGEKLIYKFKDHGNRNVAMRYDLTIPFARFVAMNPNLPMPFRRYHMGPVWRADKPQHGRFREFWQCDADIAGSDSYVADVEILNLAYDFFCEININKFIIRINDRRVLNALLRFFSFKEKVFPEILRSIDKLDKIGPEGVENELVKKGYPVDDVSNLLSLLTMKLTVEETIAMLRDKITDNKDGLEGIKCLENIFRLIKSKNKGPGFFALDLSLARGLSYYNSIIYETVVEEPKIGSLLGGGRYDNLIGMFCGKKIPATGFAIGFERIVAVLGEVGLFKENLREVKALITVFSSELIDYSFEIAQELRKQGINVEVYANEAAKLAKQIDYANKSGINYALILGPEEKQKKLVTLKTLKTREQKTIALKDVLKIIKAS